MAFLQRRPSLTSHVVRSIDDARRLRPSPLPRRRSFATASPTRTIRLVVAAQGENSESVSGNLTEEEARLVLGVTEETPFDEIVKIKNRLLLSPNLNKASIKEVTSHKHALNDRAALCVCQIQRAYDLLLMKSMTKRVQSSEEVPRSVRYADVQKRDLAKEAKKALSQIPTGGIVIENPSKEAMRANSIVLGVLALTLLPQVRCQESSDTQSTSMPDKGVSPLTETVDVIPGLQLALAFMWSVYAFRQYRLLGLGRAFGYSFLGLLIGGLGGGAIESVLHVQQHPIAGFHSPATLIGECSLLGVWATATFLA